MIAYLFLVLVSVLAGFGVLALSGLRLSAGERWCLSPGMCLVFWSILIGIGVSLGVPVRTLALPLWLVTGLAASYGAWRARVEWSREAAVRLAFIACLPVGVMAYDFTQGLANYIGGWGDGWSYVAYGQYLWQWPKGTAGPLTPLYQYSVHLAHTRFVASALLGLFSLITGEAGDTQAAAGGFVAWTLFVFGASCAAYGSANFVRRGWLLAFCVMAVTSRWVYGAVQIHNYDNLLALSFAPMAMAIVAQVPRPALSNAVVLGGILAAVLYCYPEMAPFVVLGVVFALGARVSRDGGWVAWSAVGAGAASLTGVLVLAGWSDLVWFISNQLGSATAAVGSRAGEGLFASLLNVRDWNAQFWGYVPLPGDGGPRAAWDLGRQLLGVSLSLLLVAGAVRLAVRRQWDAVLFGFVLTSGAVFMVVDQAYSYGAYKFLLFESWAIAAFVVYGAQSVAERLADTQGQSGRAKVLPAAAAVAGMSIACALVAVFVIREVMFHKSLAVSTIEPYRSVEAIDGLIGSAPLVVSIDNGLANQWAVYFLRDHPMRLMGYRGYMALPHVAAVMDQSASADLGAVQYALSDDGGTGRDVVWSRGPYVLWRFPASGGAFLGAVTNPNGAERVNGRSFYWIGNEETAVDVVATADGEATLFGRFVRGPSLPGSPERHLALSANASGRRTVTIASDGEQTLSVPVRRGKNRVLIRALDEPTLVLSRDPRPLLVGIEGLSAWMGGSTNAVPKAALVTGSCSATFVSGWYPREELAAGWLRWSSGTGRLRVVSKETADFELRGELLSLVRPNTVDVIIDGVRVTTWTADDPAWGSHEFEPVAFHLAAGHAATIDLASRVQSITQPTDPRPLTIAIKDLALERTDQPALCTGLADGGP